MFKLKVEGKEYDIKDSWRDFTFDEYCQVINAKGKGFLERLSVFTSIPLGELNRMNCEHIAVLCGLVSFMETPETAMIFAEYYTDELNIGKRKYSELEAAKIALQSVKVPVLAGDKILEIYYGAEDLPLFAKLGKISFVLSEMEKFLQRFKRLNDYEPSPEELEAGVDNLSKFGFFATVVQFARKYGKTHDEILAMPAEEVYTTLLFDFEQNEIERNLIKIQNRKRK